MSDPGDDPVAQFPNGPERRYSVQGSEDSDAEAGVQRGGRSSRPRPGTALLVNRPSRTAAVCLRQPVRFRHTRRLRGHDRHAIVAPEALDPSRRQAAEASSAIEYQNQPGHQSISSFRRPSPGARGNKKGRRENAAPEVP
jgi:hypothetical protein